MKRPFVLLLALFITACSNADFSEETITGEITKIDASEKMVWVDSLPLYVDDIESFKVGGLVRIAFTDPSPEDIWDPSEFNVTDVEFLPASFFDELRAIAWAGLPEKIKESATDTEETAEVKSGISNSNDVFVELLGPDFDNRPAWFVSFNVDGKIQPYQVIIEQESRKVIGVRRPEN